MCLKLLVYWICHFHHEHARCVCVALYLWFIIKSLYLQLLIIFHINITLKLHPQSIQFVIASNLQFDLQVTHVTCWIYKASSLYFHFANFLLVCILMYLLPLPTVWPSLLLYTLTLHSIFVVLSIFNSILYSANLKVIFKIFSKLQLLLLVKYSLTKFVS